MKNKIYFIATMYLFLSVSGSLHCIGEKTIKLGGDSSWRMADLRSGIAEVSRIRPSTVLVLSSAASAGVMPDLSLSFDEGNSSLFRDSSGNYRVSVSPSIEAVDRRYSWAGFGAAHFLAVNDADTRKAKSGGPLVLEIQNNNALLAPNKRINDFSLEFWLHPAKLENGEQILLWAASRPMEKSVYSFQRILCNSSKNRLQWSFQNFFIGPDGSGCIDINLAGNSAVVPKTWSHHLIRFDSGSGLLEYVMNGKTEAIKYATVTGHEGSEVYTPITGEGGSLVLGGNFVGLMDEFKIHDRYIPGPVLRKYPLPGGRMETRAIDLGAGSNGIVMVEASGGRTSILNMKIAGEYKQNGRFRFSDDSEMQFFIRASDNPYRWESTWQPVTPGAGISSTVKGRYVQMAVDFYPSAGGETSPYLEELRITYLPDEPPLPPAQLTAVALDGTVQLYWKNSPDRNTQGYLVYYGTSADDYFGEDASQGISPIDAGKCNTFNIDGLKNGTLYYFRVAAYSYRTAGSFHAGEFSREVRARPLQGISALY